jgi:hypothetical protein
MIRSEFEKYQEMVLGLPCLVILGITSNQVNQSLTETQSQFWMCENLYFINWMIIHIQESQGPLVLMHLYILDFSCQSLLVFWFIITLNGNSPF